MARVIGPTVPRWRLGEQLTALREHAGVSVQHAAETLGCSEWKIRKIEQGSVGVVKTELAAMLDLYGVADDEVRDQLRELQRLGKQRGWWSKHARHLTVTQGTFLGLESAATTIRVWEPTYVPGLLQTEEYLCAILASERFPADRAAHIAEVRMTRQKVVWEDEPPTAWFVLDEAVLRRPVGGPDVMRAQLRHLLDRANRCTLQVLPFGRGAHPGMLGALTIFEFDEELHSPVGYVESQAGDLYVEDDELERCKFVIAQVSAAALSPQETAELIGAAAAGYEKGRPQ